MGDRLPIREEQAAGEVDAEAAATLHRYNRRDAGLEAGNELG